MYLKNFNLHYSTVPDPHVHHLHIRMCILHHSGHQQRLCKCTGADTHCNTSGLTLLSVLILLKMVGYANKKEKTKVFIQNYVNVQEQTV